MGVGLFTFITILNAALIETGNTTLCLSLISLYFYNKGKIFLSSSLIAILGFIKVFPLLLSVAFLKSHKKNKFFKK